MLICKTQLAGLTIVISTINHEYHIVIGMMFTNYHHIVLCKSQLYRSMINYHFDAYFFCELPSLPWLTTGGYLKKKVNMLFNDFINQLITGGISALYVVKKTQYI